MLFFAVLFFFMLAFALFRLSDIEFNILGRLHLVEHELYMLRNVIHAKSNNQKSN